MGGGSSVDRQTLEWEDSMCEALDLRKCRVYLVKDKCSTEEAVSRVKKNWIYVDCELHYVENVSEGTLGLVSIAVSSEECYIFDTITYEQSLPLLKEVLESYRYRKVFHDCASDIAILHKLGVDVDGVDDTLVAHRIVEMSRHAGIYDDNCQLELKDLYYQLIHKKFPIARGMSSPGNHKQWISVRPLDEEMIKYAAINVLLLPAVHAKLSQFMQHNMKTECRYKVMENQRIAVAALYAKPGVELNLPDARDELGNQQIYPSISSVIASSQCSLDIVLVDEMAKANVALQKIHMCNLVFVACEMLDFGIYGNKIGFIQIATSSTQCFIFDIVHYVGSVSLLNKIFYSKDIKKFFHNGYICLVQLKDTLGIEFNEVDDTLIVGKKIQYGLKDNACSSSTVDYKRLVSELDSLSLQQNSKYIYPIPEDVKNAAASKALLIARVYEEINRLTEVIAEPEKSLMTCD